MGRVIRIVMTAYDTVESMKTSMIGITTKKRMTITKKTTNTISSVTMTKSTSTTSGLVTVSALSLWERVGGEGAEHEGAGV